MNPQRIQQRRTAGWRKPENTIAVGRGTRWGNPYSVPPEMLRLPYRPAGRKQHPTALGQVGNFPHLLHQRHPHNPPTAHREAITGHPGRNVTNTYPESSPQQRDTPETSHKLALAPPTIE